MVFSSWSAMTTIVSRESALALPEFDQYAESTPLRLSCTKMRAIHLQFFDSTHCVRRVSFRLDLYTRDDTAHGSAPCNEMISQQISMK
jgi:hypothetical protein